MNITTQKQADKALSKLTSLKGIVNTHVLIEGEPSISMAALHNTLGSQIKFNTWVERFMVRAEANVEGVDFINVDSDLLSVDNDTSTLTDTFVSYDVAERIAVLSNTTMGKQILKDLQAAKKIAKVLVQLTMDNQAKLLKALGNGVCTSDQARAAGYLTAMEIKNILGLKTSHQVIKAVTDFYILPVITAGTHTFISLVHFIPAWNQWKSESELKSVVSTCTYRHIFSNTVFEA